MADQLLQEIYVSLFGFSYAFWENEERIWGKKKVLGEKKKKFLFLF